VGSLVQAIREAAVQLNEMCRHLLGLVRPGELRCCAENPRTVVEQAVRLTRGALGTITVELDVATDQPIWCARPVLVQALTGLLENAAHAAGPSGRVKITARSSDGIHIIDVWDDGPGVPAELRGRIFDPFFTTKEVGKGTGLGLTMARAMIERHRGTLALVDSPKGTLFRIELPSERGAKREHLMMSMSERGLGANAG
jgi:signal transduction histidine kinase